jgi:hypothetical protein
MLKLKNGILFAADDLSQAQILRVDYFQKDLDTFSIYYPRGVYSTMNFLVGSGSSTSLNIVQSDFYHQIITNSTATYPIKSVETAYQELQAGKGYVAANFANGSEIKIKDVFLGYFAGDNLQQYLMPVYVFKGLEDEFYAYVLALDTTSFSDVTPSGTSKK